MKKLIGLIGTAAILLPLATTPAHSGGAISNFNVKNCTQERIFVCSFDKTDGRQTIPYKARGIQPGDKKEFGCASIGRCKVIIGVSKRKTQKMLSSGMEAALGVGSIVSAGATGALAGSALGATAAGGAGQVFVFGAGELTAGVVAGASSTAALTVAASAAAVVAVAAGGAVAGIEIAEGWKDGEVCKNVKEAAKSAGLEPKRFMQNGKKYQVIEKYATNRKGNPYVNSDGTAVFAYEIKKGKAACPVALQTQLISD